MSGTANPPPGGPNLLAQGGAPPAAPNLLSSGQGAPQRVPAPAVPTVNGQAAQLIAATQGMGPEERQTIIDHLTYTTNELAKLAGKKGVTRKDVVKATSDAIGARVITADDGIRFLGQIPDDPQQLRPWLNAMYHEYLVTSVAMHAVDTIHAQANSQPQVVPTAVPAVAIKPPTEAPPTPPGIEPRSIAPPPGVPAVPGQGT